MPTRPWPIVAILAALIAGAATPAAGRTGNRIGGGVNYWVALSDLDADDVNENGFGYFVSFQHKGELLGFGLDLELLPKRFGKDSVAPQAYLLLGKAIYVGAGIGIIHTDDGFADDPFFSFRGGLDLELLPSLFLDLYGQYRFESSSDLKDRRTDIDTDTIFLGAALRIGF